MSSTDLIDQSAALVSNSQVIGCEDRPHNDLYCVEWGVKLYSVQSIPVCCAQTCIDINGMKT